MTNSLYLCCLTIPVLRNIYLHNREHRISWLTYAWPNRLNKPLAWDFVIDKQNFKKTSIGNTKKTLRKCYCSRIRIGKKIVRFKFTLLLPKQCASLDTKALMIKIDKPVEKAKVRGPVFIVAAQWAELFSFIDTMYL